MISNEYNMPETVYYPNLKHPETPMRSFPVVSSQNIPIIPPFEIVEFTPPKTELPKIDETPCVTPINETPRTEVPLPSHDNEERSNEIKIFYESRTRELILTQAKSSLDLFKIIHNTLDDFQTKILNQTHAIVELSKVITSQQEKLNVINDAVDDLKKQVDNFKVNSDDSSKKNEKDAKDPKPPLKRTSSYAYTAPKPKPKG